MPVEMLLWIMIALLLINCGLNMHLYVKAARRERMVADDERIGEAMEAAAREEARRSQQMNEGFENLMGYEVNLGRGVKTGGEL